MVQVRRAAMGAIIGATYHLMTMHGDGIGANPPLPGIGPRHAEKPQVGRWHLYESPQSPSADGKLGKPKTKTFVL